MQENKVSNDLLRTEDARLRAILRTTVDGIATIDERGIVQYFNPAAEKMFGYRSEEVIGQNISMLMPTPYRESHDQYVANYLRTGEAKIIGIGREVVGLRKDTSRFPLDLAISEFKVGDRRMFTGIMRDVSDRKRLERAIVSAGENVRRHIGQELHDVLGQQLTGISLLAKTLEKRLVTHDEKLQSSAADINKLARDATVEVKRLANGLYSSVLQKKGLASALAELAVTQKRLYRSPCMFEVEPGVPSFDQSTELNLYRIAQEAVHNAVKHAEARHIVIRLVQQDEMVQLIIEDDGVGISKGFTASEGMGLPIMQYRADTIGATFEIKRNPQNGTTVTCTLPYARC